MTNHCNHEFRAPGLQCVVLAMFITMSSGCLAPNAGRLERHPRKWFLILDAKKYLSYRIPSIEKEFADANQWPIPKDAAWKSIGDFEAFASSQLSDPGTFVYIIRVGCNTAETDHVATVLGKRGVFALSQSQSLQSVASEGRDAEVFLKKLAEVP